MPLVKFMVGGCITWLDSFCSWVIWCNSQWCDYIRRLFQQIWR